MVCDWSTNPTHVPALICYGTRDLITGNFCVHCFSSHCLVHKIAVSPFSWFFFVLFCFLFLFCFFFFSTACVCTLRYRRIGSCLSCAYILRLMNALGNFEEHSRAPSCVSKLPACIQNSTYAHLAWKKL